MAANFQHLAWLVPVFASPVFAIEILACVACCGRRMRRIFALYVAVVFIVFAAVLSDLTVNNKAIISATTGFTLQNWPKPKAVVPGTAVVKVKAVALNPADYKLINNLASVPFVRYIMPHSPSYDMSGVVTEVGPRCNFKVGDEIFGQAFGAHREYTTISCDLSGKLPAKASFAQGAAVVTPVYTAIVGLPVLKAKDIIVIVGASGGTGQAGTIYAKLKNAGEIICIASGKNRESSLARGCTKFYDYTSADFDASLTKDLKGRIDVVYDCVTEPFDIPSPYVGRLMPLMKPTGLYVALNPSPDALRGDNYKRFHTFVAAASREDVDYASKHIEFFKEMAIAHTAEGLSVSNLVQSYDLLKSHRTAGRIVLTIGDQKRSQ